MKGEDCPDRALNVSVSCVFSVFQDLEDMFLRYGRIVDIRLNRDRFTGRCKGFAFVAMSCEEEVDEVSDFHPSSNTEVAFEQVEGCLLPTDGIGYACVGLPTVGREGVLFPLNTDHTQPGWQVEPAISRLACAPDRCSTPSVP